MTIGTLTPADFTRSIIEDVARKHGVKPAEIFGPLKTRRIVDARDEAIRLVSQARPKWSYPTLGKYFGGRDHTTIMASLERSGGREPRGSRYHSYDRFHPSAHVLSAAPTEER